LPRQPTTASNARGPPFPSRLAQALQWDFESGCYEVVDGELFERRFDELRRKRDRDDGSNGRPFSRMHKYYKLQFGERWAKTVCAILWRQARFHEYGRIHPCSSNKANAPPTRGCGLGRGVPL